MPVNYLKKKKKVETEGIFSTSFSEINNTLTPKPGKDTTKKKTTGQCESDGYRLKNAQYNTCKQNTDTKKRKKKEKQTVCTITKLTLSL